MKQTAVEWLVEQMIKYELLPKNIHPDNVLFHKAKEMEKMQHQETFNQARLAKIFEKDMPLVWDSWYQYYNIIFKSE